MGPGWTPLEVWATPAGGFWGPSRARPLPAASAVTADFVDPADLFDCDDLVEPSRRALTDATPNVTTVPSLHDLAGVVVEAVFAFTRLAMPDGWFVARLLRLLPVSRGPSIPRAVCLAGRSHPVPLEGYLASSRLHGRRTRPGDATKSSLLRFTTDATGGSKDRETISGGRHVGLSSLTPTLSVFGLNTVGRGRCIPFFM